MAASNRYTLAATRLDELAAVNALEAELFGSDPARLPSLVGWYAANPCGFSVLHEAGDKVVGCINFLALKEQALAGLVCGELGERDIRPEDLLLPSDRSLVQHIYCESIAIAPNIVGRGLAVALVVAQFDPLLKRVSELAVSSWIYGSAATPSGRQLMTKLGAEVVSTASSRIDGRDLLRARVCTLLNKASSLTKFLDNDRYREIKTRSQVR